MSKIKQEQIEHFLSTDEAKKIQKDKCDEIKEQRIWCWLRKNSPFNTMEEINVAADEVLARLNMEKKFTERGKRFIN